MKPLCSVCAFRIWKISSCFRMPVAPATFRSLAICVSLAMLMSLSSPMFSVSAVRRGASLARRGAAGFTASVAAAASTAPAPAADDRNERF